MAGSTPELLTAMSALAHPEQWLGIINPYGEAFPVADGEHGAARELLEDVRDIIVSRKGRASQRSSRLVQQEGNFYGWLIAPPHYNR